MPFFIDEIKSVFKEFGGKLVWLKDDFLERITDMAAGEVDIEKEVQRIQERIDNSPFRGYLLLVYTPGQVWFPPTLELRYTTGIWRYRNRVKNFYPIYAEICDRVKELDNSISGQNDAWECRKAILVNNGYNGR